MKMLPLLLAGLILTACALRAETGEVSAALPDCSLGDPTLDRAADRVYAELQALFRKYYPKAVTANLHRNGMSFEYDMTTYELPWLSQEGKGASTTQPGPKKGGIDCGVTIYKGRYCGQYSMFNFAKPDSTLGPVVSDEKVFKQMLMAPYSAKQDASLFSVLSYPSDASAEFLKEYVAIMTAFEEESGVASGDRPSEKSANVLEGTLRMHPKFQFRYSIDGFGDGQKCALFNADDRLNQIKPGSLVRVRGNLASEFFGPRHQMPQTDPAPTWIIYMNVDDVEVLRVGEAPPDPRP